MSAEVAEAIAAARTLVRELHGLGYMHTSQNEARLEFEACDASLHEIARVARREALTEVVGDDDNESDGLRGVRACRLLRDAENE